VLFIGLSGFASNAIADDTDIYTNAGVSSGDALVMLSLDYRSSLGSTVCNGSQCDFLVCGYDEDGNSNGESCSSNICPTTKQVCSKPTTYFALLQAGLRYVFYDIDGIHLGLMMSHDNTNRCTGPYNGSDDLDSDNDKCSNGGYMLKGFTEMGAGSADRADFFDKLATIREPQGNVSHNYQGKELFFEFFRYLTGQGIYNGHLGWTDFGTNNTNNLGNASDLFPSTTNVTPGWDTGIESGVNYVSPLSGDCTKVFSMNFMFDVSNQEDNSDSAITASKANGGMSGINLSGRNNNFETVVQYLNDVDLADGTFGSAADLGGTQNVTSYFFTQSISNQNNTINDYARAGGSNLAYEVGDDPAAMVETLNSILNQILSVSTTFVSSSVPVNVFNRSEFLDNVFIAIFEANVDNEPTWVGNLKRLQLNLDPVDADGNILPSFIADVNGISAFGSDGKLVNNALTFWTDPTGVDVITAVDDEVSGKDGKSVSRGGAGQKIPGFLSGEPELNNATSNARQLFTNPTSGTTLVDIDATTTKVEDFWTDLAVEASPGAYADASSADKDEALVVLKYIRGYDIDASNNVNANPRWMLGDPMHSRPFPINYGALSGFSESNPDIRILMGSNDGYLRMFKNTLDSTGSYAASGEEVWAFMPRELMDIQKTLKDNVVADHPYGLDGSPAIYAADAYSSGGTSGGDGTLSASDGDKVYTFFGLRRGGKSYYGLDISNPDSPSYKWNITKTSGGDLDEMGLTFSDPRIGKVKYDSTQTTAMIVAGGYDTNKDTRNANPGTDDNEGNAIYIVDLETGALIWKATYGASTGSVSATNYQHADMVNSIPSTITSVDTDGDQFIDRLYVADSGGNLWRIDLYTTDRTKWSSHIIAKLGRHGASGRSQSNDRRFFHRPDFVLSRDETGNFDAVIIGSGDRANPKDEALGTLPINHLYMIKDRFTSGQLFNATTACANRLDASNNPVCPTISTLANLTNHCFQENAVCNNSSISDGTTYTSTTNLTNGWYVVLEDSGEKNLSSPLTLGGTILFTTYVPNAGGANSCAPSEGSGYVYAVDLQTAKPTLDLNSSETETDAEGNPILVKADRKRYIGAGIPADPVALGKDKVLLPGGNILDLPIDGTWRTFWYEVGME